VKRPIRWFAACPSASSGPWRPGGSGPPSRSGGCGERGRSSHADGTAEDDVLLLASQCGLKGSRTRARSKLTGLSHTICSKVAVSSKPACSSCRARPWLSRRSISSWSKSSRNSTWLASAASAEKLLRLAERYGPDRTTRPPAPSAGARSSAVRTMASTHPTSSSSKASARAQGLVQRRPRPR
jgi:hypothetical protein